MTRPEECLAVVDGIGSSATFTNLPDGRILAYSNGQFHASADGGLTWPQRWDGKFAGKKASSDGSLIVFKDKTLGLAARLIPPPPPGIGPRPRGDAAAEDEWKRAVRRSGQGTPDLQHIALWRSNDGGKSWSGPVRISPPEEFIQAAYNDVAVRGSTGRIFVPAYGQGHLYVYFTDDEGATWQRSKNYPRSIAEYRGRKKELDQDEPSIVEGFEPAR